MLSRAASLRSPILRIATGSRFLTPYIKRIPQRKLSTALQPINPTDIQQKLFNHKIHIAAFNITLRVFLKLYSDGLTSNGLLQYLARITSIRDGVLLDLADKTLCQVLTDMTSSMPTTAAEFQQVGYSKELIDITSKLYDVSIDYKTNKFMRPHIPYDMPPLNWMQTHCAVPTANMLMSRTQLELTEECVFMMESIILLHAFRLKPNSLFSASMLHTLATGHALENIFNALFAYKLPIAGAASMYLLGRILFQSFAVKYVFNNKSRACALLSCDNVRSINTVMHELNYIKTEKNIEFEQVAAMQSLHRR